MRICVPAAGNNGLDEKIHGHFGSADCFVIFDDQSKEVDISENEAHEHGKCVPVDTLKKLKVDVILTHGMGRRAVGLLMDSNIKVFVVKGQNVGEAIKHYQAGVLKELSMEDACAGH